MTPHSEPQGDKTAMSEVPKECLVHGEKIATILANTTAIKDRLDQLNGRTAKSEDRLNRVEARCAGHQMMDITTSEYRRRLEVWQSGIESRLEPIETMQAQQQGERTSNLRYIERIAMLVALGISAWAAYSNHLEAIASAVRK
jgi:hypothetical protein